MMRTNPFVFPDLLNVDLGGSRHPGVCRQSTSQISDDNKENLQPNAMIMMVANKRMKRHKKKLDISSSTALHPMNVSLRKGLNEQTTLSMPQRKNLNLADGDKQAGSALEVDKQKHKVVSPELQKMCQRHARYMERSKKASTRGRSGLKVSTSAKEIECLSSLDATSFD
ncbi:hypothetical protein AB1Y20_007564 [Prymnesium parvum]|uniref:Ribosome biogenesis protein RPF2 homolog n=1 Tax=Prymnesium parvum TaxID=97485 RepID=A0AB34IVU1_PRYPA